MSNKINYETSNTPELIAKAQGGDADAMRLLVEINTPLVKAMTRRYNGFSIDREDLLQIGFIGLIKAVKGFDASYNVRFSTYAVPLIIGEIKRYMRDEGALKIARSIKELSQKIKNFCEVFAYDKGREATLDEICKGLECTRESALEAIESNRGAVSLEQPISTDGTQDSLMNHLEAKRGLDWLDIIQLRDCLKELKPQEKQIIVMRYYNNLTQTKIAQQLGMSQVQISRMESRILKKLKARMK